MKSPSITAVLKNGQWTVAYIGADAGPAKEAYTAAVNANAEGAMLFIRPEFTRRFKGDLPNLQKADAKKTGPKKKGE